MADLATLSIKVDASGAVQVLDQLGNKLGQTSSKAETLSATVGKLAAVFAGFQAAKFAQDTLNLGARYETLGVVMDVLGRNAGKTRAEMDGFQASLQKTGISMIGARESLARMAGAQLDMAKSSELARVAQNAAVIANVNSSEAFDTLINGITTGQPRILRTLGIFVDMEAGQQKYARSLGKSAEELTSAERTQANMNTAMQGGVAIAGAYEAAMGTAGKQLLSTVRYMEDARVKASLAFQPAYTQAVFGYANALKYAGDNATTITGIMAGLATAIGLVAGALVAVKVATLALAVTPIGLAISAAVALLAAAAGLYVKQVTEAKLVTNAFSESLVKMPINLIQANLTAVNEALKDYATRQANLAAAGKSDISTAGTEEHLRLLGLQKELTLALTAATKAHGVVAKAAEEAETAALLKFNDEKRKGLANAQMERDWKLAHLDLLGKEAAAEAKVAEQIEIATQKADKFYAINRKIFLGGPANLIGLTPGLEGFGGRNVPGLPDTLEVKSAVDQQIAEYTRGADVRKQLASDAGKYETKVTLAEIAEQAKIREQFMKQFQQTVANGIANMLENGIQSWRSFFDSIKSMFIKLVADFAAAKIMDKILNNGQNAAGATSLGAMFGGDFGKGGGGTAMAGASVALTAGMIGYGVGGMTRNTTTGALAGGAAGAASGAAMGALLGPIGAGAGALIGGLAGLVTGFMGASAAAKKYAEDMVKQQNSLLAAAQAFVDRGLTGQAKIESEQNKLAKERDDLLNGLAANFKAGGFGKDGAANYQHTVEEIGFAYDRQKKALEATTKAAEDYSLVLKVAAEFEETNFVRSLRARELRAAGATEEADALDLFNRQVAEFADAVKKGYDETTLARLAYVQSLEVERTAYRANLAAQITAANATRMSAMAAENLASGLEAISPAWQRVIDALAKSRDAAEQTANAIRKTVDATRSLFENLAGYTKSLLVGGLSPLTKSQQVAEARSQFEDAARKAAFGDLAAGGKVTGLATQFLTLIKETSQASAQAAQDAAQAALPKYFRTAMPTVEGTQTAEYQQAFADVSAMIDAATLGVGGQLDIQVQQLRQAELQTAILNRMLAQSSAAARGLPFFASGGEHSGGIALVGERGPELINTGRARIFSAADSAAAFAGNGTATVEELRRVIARLETLVRVTAAGAQETVKAVARVSSDVASLTREVRLSGEAAA